jgi:hypothetical protein
MMQLYKNVKKLVLLLLVLILHNSQAVYSDCFDYEYNEDSNSYSVSGYLEGGRCNTLFIKRLDIPSSYKGKPVTGINPYVLYSGGGNYFRLLEHITIPSSIKNIGDLSFCGLPALKHVTIENGVINIGYGVFSRCHSLKGITIPASVTRIGIRAFSGENFESVEVEKSNEKFSTEHGVLFSKDKSVIIRFPSGRRGKYTIPNSVTRISSGAFIDGSSLASVIIPDSVTSIGNQAFADCFALVNMTIPDSVTSIGDRAFSSCVGLTSVAIPDSVNSIGVAAFGGCRRLKTINISDNNIHYLFEGGVLYNKNKTKLIAFPTAGGNYTIPAGVKSVEGGAFVGCGALNYITIGNNVDSVGEWAFQDCRNLFKATISNRVTSLGSGAFYRCRSLSEIIIGKGINRIEDSTFGWCDSLESVNISDSITTIGNSAFSYCWKLKSLTIPKSVTSIGDEAFFYCSSLTSVTIPNSVTSIGAYAFVGCQSLTSITFEGNAPNFSSNTFWGVSNTFWGVGRNAKIFTNPGATGFGETFEGLPVVILKKLKINTFSKSAAPFTLTFESKSGSTYIIEVSHDLKKWGEIGEVKGTGSSVKFTDPRLPIVPFERNYFRVKLVE